MTHPPDGEQALLAIERSRMDSRHPSADSDGASSIGASSAGTSHAAFSARAARTGGPISSAIAVSGFVPRGGVAGVTVVGAEHRYTEVALQSPGERLEELVQGGRSRRDALRQVARENMGAEVEAGLLETLTLGGLAPRCCRCCQFLILIFVFVIVAVFILISVCFVFMNVCGWFLSLSLLFCPRQPALRHWLLVLQTLMLVEGVVGGVMHGLFRSQPHLASAYRVHVVVLAACYDLFSATFKVGWCLRTQQLVAAATALALAAADDSDIGKNHGSQEAGGCAESLPTFMHWFAWALLLQMVVVVPLSHVGAAAAFWAARHGLLPTRRGAKPGTLEALSTVEFNAQLFANPDDPRDSRPQGECCCCLEEYSKETAIIKTPCDHMMHRECLERWLHTSHFCPICRADLEHTGPDVGQV